MNLNEAGPSSSAIPCAALIIDAAGCITDCSPAAKELLGRQSESLSGRAVAALIPGLPFAIDTPGYNIAYAVFHAADRQRMRHMALLADGRRLPIDVALGSLTMNGHLCIALTLKPSTSMVS